MARSDEGRRGDIPQPPLPPNGFDRDPWSNVINHTSALNWLAVPFGGKGPESLESINRDNRQRQLERDDRAMTNERINRPLLPPQDERGGFPEWLLNSWNQFTNPQYSPETRAAMARGQANAMEAAQGMMGGGTTRMIRPALGVAGALAQRFRGAIAPPPPAPGGVPQWYSQRLSETMQTQLRQRRANVLDDVPAPPLASRIPALPMRPPDVVGGGLRRRFGGSQ